MWCKDWATIKDMPFSVKEIGRKIRGGEQWEAPLYAPI